MNPDSFRRWAAEAIGTFCLVFAGTGAIVVNDFSEGAITHLGISATFGLIVFAMIYTFGPISGSHLNPAVTLGLWLCKRMKASDVTPYIIAQCVGALLASMTLRGMFADIATLGATLPKGGVWRAFGFEVFLTGLLMLVILNTTNPHHPAKDYAGFVIGAVVGLEALFGGPISGASMNPARSLGPALVSGAIADLWIYWTAPWLGILAAVSMHRLLMFSTTEDRESQVEHTTIEPEHK